MIKTKSIASRAEKSDGLRVLATRFRGRNVAADRYDVWMANLGPSETLLRAFLAKDVSWREFSKRYREQLFAMGAADRHNKTIRDHGQKFTLRLLKKLGERGEVTLMCHCAENEEHCHRHLLKAVIESKRV